jgi:hypothetical protein
MKSESMRHNTIKIKNKKQLHFVLIFFNSESGGVRNKLQRSIQIKLNESFEIEKKKEREKQQFIITHIHIQTVKKIKQFIHPSKPIRIDC